MLQILLFAFTLLIRFFVYICFLLCGRLFLIIHLSFLQVISHTYMSHIVTHIPDDSHNIGDSYFSMTHIMTRFFTMTFLDSSYDSH